jgi:hypothetical protein
MGIIDRDKALKKVEILDKDRIGIDKSNALFFYVITPL